MEFQKMMLSLLVLFSAVDWAQAIVCGANDVARTVRFEATLTWQYWAPDGVRRKAILTNGQFPAPTLELCQGDNVEFLVINLLPFSTTVHFHGIDQLGTPWSDGVPGVSQRPIKPNDTFLYKWKATNYGSYFYHAHSRGQIEDGLYGAIYIKPGEDVQRPFNEISTDSGELQAMRSAEDKTQPIILSEWRNLTSEELWQAEEATGLDAYCTNAFLINGKGSITCLSRETIEQYTTVVDRIVLNGSHLTDMACYPPTGYAIQGPYSHNLSAIPPGLFSGCIPSQGPTEVLKVNPQARYVSWDLISATGVSTFIFSIDEHPMYVYAIDGRYIKPMLVDAIVLPPGKRYSVLVHLDRPARNYYVRSVSAGFNQIKNATAIMSYTDASKTAGSRQSKPYISLNGGNATADTTYLDESKVVPFPPITPAQTADETFILTIHQYNSAYRWVLSNNSYPLSLETENPLLFNPKGTAAQNDLLIRTNNGSWVDIIVTVITPADRVQPPHPIHKHSNKFFVIGSGQGAWNYSSVAEAMKYIPESFNLINPPMHDTFPTPPSLMESTWMALRYQVVNPGAFLLHCHIQIHQSGGMALAILDGVDAWPQVPPEYLNHS